MQLGALCAGVKLFHHYYFGYSQVAPSVKQPASHAVSFSPLSSRLSRSLLAANGSLISLLFCPSRTSDSGRPTPLLFLFNVSWQLYLLASSGPVSQPHL